MVAKTKYETHVLPKLFLVECWARDGVIDEDIAKKLGIAYSTFCDYKSKFSELSEALKRGKEVIDFEVENALLKRALGYSYEEVYTKTNGFETEVKKTIKHVAGDTTAQIFWLKNRRPDKWRDKREIETSDGNNKVTILDDIKDCIKKGDTDD